MNETVLKKYAVTATGTQFSVTDTAGSTYLIYGLSSSLTLTADYDSSLIVASSPYTGVLRLALNQTSDQTLLDQYYQVYRTSVGLDYFFTDAAGTLIFSWDTTGADASDLLMLTWPHHRQSLQNPNYPPTMSLSYLTTKVSRRPFDSPCFDSPPFGSRPFINLFIIYSP
jgi:endo-1,3(4)-beta-glucanase